MPSKGLICLLLALSGAAVSISQAGSYSFTPYGEPDPTILVDADFSIKINAYSKEKTLIGSYTKKASDAKDVSIMGSNGRRSFIYLRFSSYFSWAFIFDEESEEKVTMERLVQFVPGHIFPDIIEIMDTVTFESRENTNLHATSNSFACTRKTVTKYTAKNFVAGGATFNVTVTVANFRVQAYGVKGGKFSPAVHCKEDAGITTTTTITPPTTTTKSPPPPPTKKTSTTTTTPTTTTTTPTTTTTTTTTASTTTTSTTASTSTTSTTTSSPVPATTPSPFGVNIYRVKTENDFETCIVMKGRVTFDIAYNVIIKGRVEKRVAHLGIPDTYVDSGSCGVGKVQQQTLTIRFFKYWFLEIVFKLKPKQEVVVGAGVTLATPIEDLEYDMASIRLTYIIDHDHFPGASERVGTKHSVAVNDEATERLPEKRLGSSFFNCSSGVVYKLSKDVRLTTAHIKFKAFNDNMDPRFEGHAAMCNADKPHKPTTISPSGGGGGDKNHTKTDWLPIIGWIIFVLFILFLLALLIYVICRHYNKNSYTQI